MEKKMKAEALARARAEIAGRIARYCKNLSPEELDALLDRMAGIQCKYDAIGYLRIPERTPPRTRGLD